MREGLHKIAFREDTIVALSTPFGRSGIGVVRVSGSLAQDIGKRFFKGSRELAHGRAVAGRWNDAGGELVDEVIAVFFKGPRSYTGEDVLEISAHGNPLILNRIVCMFQSAGARLAMPGEFTLRAVSNGKMDLIQAEAVRAFIEAQTDRQAHTALRQMEGALSKRITPIKEQLVEVVAHLEAGIDFAEDDVELPNVKATAERLAGLANSLEALQQTYAFGRLLNNGVRIVIAGKPNVGKSSLFNRLVEADRAIVTDTPGTTRDVIAESANLDGIPLQFLDTAGVRDSGDAIERIGVTRTLETLAEADLVLFVIDGSSALDEEDRRVQAGIRHLPHLVVANKADLPPAAGSEIEGLSPIRLSALTGEGLSALKEAMRQYLGSSRGEGVTDSVLTSARQSDAVAQAAACVKSGETALMAGTPHEMVLLDLYGALSSLNELTGETTTDDILGQVFSTFCIGK